MSVRSQRSRSDRVEDYRRRPKEGWKGQLHFSDVTERNITLMDDVLAKKGLKESSRWNYHKIVKTIIIRAMEDDLLKRNPYNRIDTPRYSVCIMVFTGLA